MTSPYVGAPLCCDADALITLIRTRLFVRLDILAQRGLLRVPRGVFDEVYPHQRPGPERRMLERWKDMGDIVVDIDRDEAARMLLPAIERRYGLPFSIGGVTYRGFWNSRAGRDAADGEVVTLAKVHGWTVVANDNSLHGACLLEKVESHRWEYLARLAETEPDPPAAPYQPPLGLT